MTAITRAKRSEDKTTSKERAREAMVERILDAAEHLFAEYGFHGVTVTDVAKSIGVSPTLLHYHFKGKESIYDAVWARKAPLSSQRRLAEVRRYAAEAGDDITVEGALAAWINPDLDAHITDDTFWADFGRIAAQANSAGMGGADKMNAYFDPIVMTLIGLLKQAMPGVPEERIFFGFHFISGALTHVQARTGRLDRLSNGLCTSDDFVSVRRYFVDFMAAGMKAMCQPENSAAG